MSTEQEINFLFCILRCGKEQMILFQKDSIQRARSQMKQIQIIGTYTNFTCSSWGPNNSYIIHLQISIFQIYPIQWRAAEMCGWSVCVTWSNRIPCSTSAARELWVGPKPNYWHDYWSHYPHNKCNFILFIFLCPSLIITCVCLKINCEWLGYERVCCCLSCV